VYESDGDSKDRHHCRMSTLLTSLKSE